MRLRSVRFGSTLVFKRTCTRGDGQRAQMQYGHGMQAVPMLDLVAQHGPLLDDLQRAAARVIASGKFLLGEEVAAFEQAVASAAGVSHAVGVSSGTDALLALLMACGVGPGDEVVTTPYSFFATAAVIARLGARPQFADVDADTMNLDPAAAAARIGRRTKAVLVVHLFGRVARLTGLKEACRQAGIPLLEDAAQAIGAWRDEDGARRVAGTLDRGGAVSFFPSKNLGGFGDGGAVITDDAELADRVRLLRNQGASRRLVHTAVGGNFRLDELQAALLRVKLPPWRPGRPSAFGSPRSTRSDSRAFRSRYRRPTRVASGSVRRSGAGGPARRHRRGVAQGRCRNRDLLPRPAAPAAGAGVVRLSAQRIPARRARRPGGARAADLPGPR